MEDNKIGKELFRISPKEVKVLSVIAALLVLGYIYISHFTNGFFYDDVFVLHQNPSIRSLKNIPFIFSDIRAHTSRPDYQIYYRPFTLLSFAWDYWIANGISTFEMHVHTFVGFMGLLALVFFFTKKVFSHFTDNVFYPVLFTTCCFAFHPIVADVLNYHYVRDEVFCTLYGMLYMVLYLYSPFCKKYYLYLIPLVVACLFTVSGMVFMPLLWLYIIYFEQDAGIDDVFKSLKATWKQMLPGIITMLLSAGLVYFKSKPEAASQVTRYTYMLTQPHVLLNFFMLFFNPENLNPDAWRDFVTSPSDYHFIIGSFFVITLVASIYLLSLKRHLRPISFGLAWFLICVLPSHSIFPLLLAQNDYHMFPSVIGLSIALCGLVMLLIKYYESSRKVVKPIVISASLVFLVVMAYGSRQRVKVWSSDKLMWLDVIKKEPTNGRVLMNIGVNYMGEGDMNRAEQYFEQARAFAPAYDLVYVNLGVVKAFLKDTITADADFKYAVSLHGFDYAESCFFYGRFLHQHHRDNEAIPILRNALAQNVGLAEAWNLLMDIYYAQHDKELANVCRQALSISADNVYASKYLKAYLSDSTRFRQGGTSDSAMEKVYMAQPSVNNYITLSLQYFNKGEYQKCIDVCLKAIAIDSTSTIAYNNICAAANQLKHWDVAIAAGMKAVHFQPDYTLARNNLNYALSQKQGKK